MGVPVVKPALPTTDGGATRTRTAAERQRAHRRRQAAGKVVLPVEVDEISLCEALIAANLLSPQDTDHPQKIATALAAVVSTWCRNA